METSYRIKNFLKPTPASKTHSSGLAALSKIGITPVPRNVKEAFVTTTVVSCHTDDQAITHKTGHSKGQTDNLRDLRVLTTT